MLLRLAVVQPPTGEAPPCELTFVRLYDPPRTKLDTVLIVSDGQAWATLAQDPSFSEPDAFCDGVKEFVYRAQRPVFPILLWLTSLGQPALVPYALLFWTAAGIALLVVAGVVVAAANGSPPRAGALVGLLPGSVFITMSLGPEPLATGILLLGVLLWRNPNRRVGWALLAFTLAALMRDITLVAPAALGIWELATRRRSLVRLLPLATPAVVYVAWVVWLKARWGYWPSDASQLERVAPPFRGMWQAFPDYDAVLWFSFALLVGLLVGAIKRNSRSHLTAIGIGFAVVSTILGQNVWVSEFYRVLLPFYAFCLLAALPSLPSGSSPRRSTTVNGSA